MMCIAAMPWLITSSPALLACTSVIMQTGAANPWSTRHMNSQLWFKQHLCHRESGHPNVDIVRQILLWDALHDERIILGWLLCWGQQLPHHVAECGVQSIPAIHPGLNWTTMSHMQFENTGTDAKNSFALSSAHVSHAVLKYTFHIIMHIQRCDRNARYQKARKSDAKYRKVWWSQQTAVYWVAAKTALTDWWCWPMHVAAIAVSGMTGSCDSDRCAATTTCARALYNWQSLAYHNSWCYWACMTMMPSWTDKTWISEAVWCNWLQRQIAFWIQLATLTMQTQSDSDIKCRIHTSHSVGHRRKQHQVQTLFFHAISECPGQECLLLAQWRRKWNYLTTMTSTSSCGSWAFHTCQNSMPTSMHGSAAMYAA